MAAWNFVWSVESNVIQLIWEGTQMVPLVTVMALEPTQCKRSHSWPSELEPYETGSRRGVSLLPELDQVPGGGGRDRGHRKAEQSAGAKGGTAGGQQASTGGEALAFLEQVDVMTIVTNGCWLVVRHPRRAVERAGKHRSVPECGI